MSPANREPQGLRVAEALVCILAGVVLAGAVLAFCEPEPHVVDDLFQPHVEAAR